MMTVGISVSETESAGHWFIKNTLFYWFADLVSQEHLSDQELLAEIQTACLIQHVFLEELVKQQPQLALRLGQAFRTTAGRIAIGEIPLSAEVRSWPYESQQKTQQSFAQLAQMLGDWSSKN